MREKQLEFNWADDGENCGQPVLKLEFDQYKATVYWGWDTKQWAARAGKLGNWRNINTQAEAMKLVENAIRRDIKERIAEAAHVLNKFIDWEIKK